MANPVITAVPLALAVLRLKLKLCCPAGIVTEVGTVAIDVLLEDRNTCCPPVGATVLICTVPAVGNEENVRSGFWVRLTKMLGAPVCPIPSPDRLIFCGLTTALSLMVKMAVREPTEAGVK